MCSLRGNFFGAPLLCLVLFSYMVAPFEGCLPFAKVLFWIGAPGCMLLSIIRVGGRLLGACMVGDALQQAGRPGPRPAAARALVGPASNC
jgi:hypothetical protein